MEDPDSGKPIPVEVDPARDEGGQGRDGHGPRARCHLRDRGSHRQRAAQLDRSLPMSGGRVTPAHSRAVEAVERITSPEASTEGAHPASSGVLVDCFWRQGTPTSDYVRGYRFCPTAGDAMVQAKRDRSFQGFALIIFGSIALLVVLTFAFGGGVNHLAVERCSTSGQDSPTEMLRSPHELFVLHAPPSSMPRCRPELHLFPEHNQAVRQETPSSWAVSLDAGEYHYYFTYVDPVSTRVARSAPGRIVVTASVRAQRVQQTLNLAMANVAIEHPSPLPKQIDRGATETIQFEVLIPGRTVRPSDRTTVTAKSCLEATGGTPAATSDCSTHSFILGQATRWSMTVPIEAGHSSTITLSDVLSAQADVPESAPLHVASQQVVGSVHIHTTLWQWVTSGTGLVVTVVVPVLMAITGFIAVLSRRKSKAPEPPEGPQRSLTKRAGQIRRRGAG
jgi:hypothetical protein